MEWGIELGGLRYREEGYGTLSRKLKFNGKSSTRYLIPGTWYRIWHLNKHADDPTPNTEHRTPNAKSDERSEQSKQGLSQNQKSNTKSNPKSIAGGEGHWNGVGIGVGRIEV
jgi:hypothetical protein